MTDSIETPIGRISPDHYRPGSVRHQVFVGPKFLYALFNPNDRMHPVSRAFMTFIREGELPYRRLICNEHIVDEAATRLKKQAALEHATAFLDTLDESDLYRLESVSMDTFDEATERFRDWTDPDAALTDFVVAAHMSELGVNHIATYDSHYDAFGVTTLPYREN